MANTTSGSLLGTCLPPTNPPTDPTSICIATMFVLFGAVYVLFGYKCFKAVMFLTGFIFASFLVYLICIQEKLLPTYANAGIALCAGLLFGLITMLVQYVGLFMTGFHTGLLLALATRAFVHHLYQPQGLLVSIVALMGSGLLFAILNLQWQRCLTIVGTSVYGGALVSGAVDYLIESFTSVEWLWKGEGVPCYPVLASWPTLTLLGLVLQFTLTAPPYHLTIGKHPVRARSREQRAELRQNKYRYLYQVRTAHGDVISQNYVQAIQNKVIGPGETSTLESDATHLTMLPDGQPDLNRSVNYYR